MYQRDQSNIVHGMVILYIDSRKMIVQLFWSLGFKLELLVVISPTQQTLSSIPEIIFGDLDVKKLLT